MDKMKSHYSVLYVEDDNEVRQNYVSFLKRFYANVYEAANAEDAYGIYKNKKPSLLIIDIRLPGESGLEFLKRIRQFDHTTRAIMLTAMSDVETLVSASELKLTKYLIKPISRDELREALDLAVKEIVDYTTYANRIVYIKDDLYWDHEREKLVSDGEEIFLTRKERSLLSTLFMHKDMTIKSEDLILDLWYDHDNDKMASLKTLVKTLRKKLPVNFIKNVFGIGYKIEL